MTTYTTVIAVEELRQAAARLREAAAAATPGPWEHVSTLPDGIRPRWILGPATDPRDPYSAAEVLAVTGEMAALAHIGDPEEIISDGDMDWIALVNPAVAEPLAAWLEACAEELKTATLVAATWADAEQLTPADYIDEPDSVRHALAVARAINRGDL